MRKVLKHESPAEKWDRLFAEGKVIQMHHPAKGIRYIYNTEKDIEAAKARGYSGVDYERKTVAEPVVKADEPKPKRRGPGRPRKSEGGE